VANRSRRQPFFAGLDVRFTELEILVLGALKGQRKPRSSEDLCDEIWRTYGASCAAVLRRHISNINGQLKEAGAKQRIENVRGVGYLLMEE